jgi:hypothetical protein
MMTNDGKWRLHQIDPDIGEIFFSHIVADSFPTHSDLQTIHRLHLYSLHKRLG